jgi:hypothetical protein
MTPVDIERAAQQREFIHERLGFIRAQAEIAQRFLELGDDTGFAYAAKRMVAEFKYAVSAQEELEKILLNALEAA